MKEDIDYNKLSIEASEFLGDLYLRDQLAQLETREERLAFLDEVREQLKADKTTLKLLYLILGTYAGNAFFKPKEIVKATTHPDFEQYHKPSYKISIHHLTEALRRGVERLG